MIILLVGPAQGQETEYKKTGINKIARGKSINISSVKEDFKPHLEFIAPLPGGEKAATQLDKAKKNIPGNKLRSAILQKKSSVPKPQVLRNFEGNISNGIPNDNDMAISNDGMIVSVVNSEIDVFNTAGDMKSDISLEKFGESLKIVGNKYDPKVLYDPDEDRFIIAFLNGRTDSTSYIILAFSETNDPTGDWNLFYLPGNPLMDTSWSDFPMIALTNDELFLTINLLYNDSSWQKGFKQTVIWQMDKYSGYQGDTLIYKLYSGIKYQGNSIRNLCPVQGGSGLVGPDIYFLSDKNFSNQTDTFFLVHLTGKMDDPSTKIEVQLIQSDNEYGVAPSADQADPFNTHSLQTNDARVLSAYIQNSKIHFVGNSVNFNNNLATIFHSIITDLAETPKIHLDIIDHPYLEFGYPSIVYVGTGTGDKALIMANHTSDTVYPGYSTMLYDNGEYSDVAIAKRGDTWINAYSESDERWGDYTGLQRKYNEPGKVWASGYFGRMKKSTLNDPRTSVNGTWISELTGNVSAGIKESEKPSNTKIYPNPANDIILIDFETKSTEFLTYKLYDAQGKEVKLLMRALTKAGENQFTLSLAPLENGVYFLEISNENQKILTKKIIKQ